MDKISTYRQYIQQFIERYATYGTSSEHIERETIFDTAHDHYQLVNVGWRDEHRVYGCVLHFDIKDGKIWVQQNGTEVNVAEELMNLGVSREDIVLGFQSPYKRQLTGFVSH